MDLGINKISLFGNYKKINNVHRSTVKNCKNKMLRYTGYAIMSAAMFSAASCSYIKRNKTKGDVVEIVSKTYETDSDYTSGGEHNYKNNNVKKIYHYYPNEGNPNADKYDWVETIYPDGSIFKDSMEYQISITPDGKRTAIHTTKDEFDNTIITTTFPNGSKTRITNYKSENVNSQSSLEEIYWNNGNIKEKKYQNEYPSDSTDINSPKITEQCNEIYNKDGVLLYWEKSSTDSLKKEINKTYDNKGRLIYDSLENEKYQYNGTNKKPFRSIAEYEGCQRIKLYKNDGTVKREFFKASDGTITKK